MKGELETSNEIVYVHVPISQLGIIVRVVHLNFEDFLLLKVEIDRDLFDELRVLGVVDNLSLPNFLPPSADRSIEDDKRV